MTESTRAFNDLCIRSNRARAVDVLRLLTQADGIVLCTARRLHDYGVGVAAVLVESWERAASGREPEEKVVERTPQIDWGALLFWSVMVLYGLGVARQGGAGRGKARQDSNNRRASCTPRFRDPT